VLGAEDDGDRLAVGHRLGREGERAGGAAHLLQADGAVAGEPHVGRPAEDLDHAVHEVPVLGRLLRARILNPVGVEVDRAGDGGLEGEGVGGLTLLRGAQAVLPAGSGPHVSVRSWCN